MSDRSQVSDAFTITMNVAREMARDLSGIVGYGVIEHFDKDGDLMLVRPFANLVTDTGDLYYAQQAIAGIPPANATGAATKMTGMQLGISTTPAAKAGAGAAMVSYIAASGTAFDATYPQTNPLASGQGVEAVYKTTFPAGVGTSTTVNEATLTFGALASASTAGNTIARILTGTINKAAGDSLAVTWRNKFLGA